MYVHLLISLFFVHTKLSAQKSNNPVKVFKVGIFAPLFLDSAFDNNGLKYERVIPKFALPGLEFVQGATIALDTLSAIQPVEAFIFDVKSTAKPLSNLIQSKSLDSMDLLIGSVRDVDFKQLADFALKKNIPFVSSTYPNDGGVTGNPFLIIMNSTLKTHCEGIYNYILQNHGSEKILLVKRKGDDRVANYFKSLNEQEGKPLLQIETLTIDSSIYSGTLKKRLDSNSRSVVIGASLDEFFAKNLANACFGLKNKYEITLTGMPNWEGFKTFSGKDNYKDFPIIYTTPYLLQKGVFENRVVSEYRRLYKTKPSDLVYKGFENVYFFTKLLLKFPADLTSHLNDRSIMVFHDFNFKPVFVNKKGGMPDYFENSHLFIMRILNGVSSRL